MPALRYQGCATQLSNHQIPARGLKLSIQLRSHDAPRLSNHQIPARGLKLQPRAMVFPQKAFKPSNPRKGTETQNVSIRSRLIACLSNHQIPARGLKRSKNSNTHLSINATFKPSNPRKGTETYERYVSCCIWAFPFKPSNPRKGTETSISPITIPSPIAFKPSNPRKGTETFGIRYLSEFECCFQTIKSPQGD